MIRIFITGLKLYTQFQAKKNIKKLLNIKSDWMRDKLIFIEYTIIKKNDPPVNEFIDIL